MKVHVTRRLDQVMQLEEYHSPSVHPTIEVRVADENLSITIGYRVRQKLLAYAGSDEGGLHGIPKELLNVRLQIDLQEKRVVGMWLLGWIEQDIEEPARPGDPGP